MHEPMRVLKPILHNAIFSPFRTAIVDDQRSWKAVTFYIAALPLAKKIRRTTDRPRIGFMLPTSGLSPLAMMATWLLGRTAVPLNYLLRGEDLAYVIDDAELDAVITVKPMIDHFGELPGHVRQIRLDAMSFKGIPPLRRAARRDDDHLAALVYTSGTSGRPKGVMLTSGNLAANVRQCVEWAGFTREDVMLGVLPQFHSFGLTVLTLVPLSVGCRVIYTARFMPKKILGLLKEHRPTAFIGIPSMFNALLSAKSATPEHFASLKWIVSGSEPLPEAVFKGFKERFGVIINEGYGLTETSPVTNWCRPGHHRDHSVGQALPDVEMKIVSPTGERLGPGEEGEICFKGPNVMAGYYRMPEETAEVFDEEGYFRTGDMGRVDDDGHLYITGRIKEMLIIGGENVFPREIEEVLNAHPAVHASIVIGMQDESRGEVALAFVELEEGADFDETELRSFCRKRLAQFKVPREIRALEELPRNPTGKLMRRDLREEMQGSE
jgi:long-chain acyl-CoA synthetase